MDIDVTSAPHPDKSATSSGSNLLHLWWLLLILPIIGINLTIVYIRCRKNDAPPPREIEMDPTRNPLLEVRTEAPSSRIFSSGCRENDTQPSGGIEEPTRDPLLENRREETSPATPNSELKLNKRIGSTKTNEWDTEFLRKHIDPDHGLLDTLLANNTFTRDEVLEVKKGNSFYDRNSLLLDYILNKCQCRCLIKALLNSDQHHIANYLQANGEYNKKHGKIWPLTAKEMSIFVTNMEGAKLLDLSDLIVRLYFSKVINRTQMTFILSKPDSNSKSEALQDILSRHSLRNYEKAIDCLETCSGGDSKLSTNERFLKSKNDDLPSRYEYYPCFVQAIEVVETVGTITGLAILADELFIVRESSSVVEVYNSEAFTFSHQWNIEMADPGGIESCKNNHCLYIIGWKTSGNSRRILRVETTGQIICQWSVPDSWSYLSVAHDSNVILTVHEENKLIEYSSDGESLREIELSSDAYLLIYNLWRSVKVGDDFFVCCGLNDDDLHGVFLIDERGIRKKLFGENTDHIARLNEPVYLVVDNFGFVLVADRKNSRVLLFDYNLKFQKELLFRENSALRFPSILYLDPSRNLLYVVDHDRDGDDGQVLIFRLGDYI